MGSVRLLPPKCDTRSAVNLNQTQIITFMHLVDLGFPDNWTHVYWTYVILLMQCTTYRNILHLTVNVSSLKESSKHLFNVTVYYLANSSFLVFSTAVPFWLLRLLKPCSVKRFLATAALSVLGLVTVSSILHKKRKKGYRISRTRKTVTEKNNRGLQRTSQKFSLKWRKSKDSSWIGNRGIGLAKH